MLRQHEELHKNEGRKEGENLRQEMNQTNLNSRVYPTNPYVPDMPCTFRMQH